MAGRDARIVVVGAGIAGISAAHHLVKNGFTNVVVLEASDRIGGRIRTVEFGDGIIELGANWIHGTGKENSIFTLAKEKGLITEPYIFLDRIEGQWCTEDGRIIPNTLVKKAWNLFCKVESSLDLVWQNKQIETLTCKEFVMKRLNEALLEFQLQDRAMVSAAFTSMVNYLCFHIGDDLENVSLNLLGIFKEIPGGNVKLPLGFLEVVRSLFKQLNTSVVQLNSKVTNIIRNSAQGLVKVYCHGNEVYICDHVIVTCPLGYLKKHHEELFTPPLPPPKVKALSNMGFGKVNKIFLYFEKPFWVKGHGGIKLSWKTKWDEFDPKEWYKSIFAFDEVLDNSSVLVAWIHGNSAEHMETLPDSVIMETCSMLIQKFLKKTAVFPPTKIMRSSWCSNPLTLGSYSYYGTSSDPTDVQNLSDPLCCEQKPVVCFAGEATHIQYFSTTHGARTSGIREAKRIISYHQNVLSRL